MSEEEGKKSGINWDKFAAPTALYLIGQTITALWWASDINTRVGNMEKTTVTDGRIARLEVAVNNLSDANRDLKSSINDLVREMRRNP